MMKRKITLFAIAILLMSGCSPATGLPKSPTPVESKTKLPIMTPTATSYPGEVENRCIDITDDTTMLSDMGGTLVLNGYLRPITGKLISNPSLLLDMSSGDQTPLGTDDLTHRFVVSPSGDYLAFDVSAEDEFSKRQINILDSKGNILENAVEEDLISMEWLNDKTLLVDSQLEQYKNNPLIFFSPFDHKQKIIQPFITEAERIVPSDHEIIYSWGFYAFHKLVYNPNLTRAIYAASDQDGAKIVFRDLTSNKDISTLRSHEAWGVSPKWSPDGTTIAIGIDTNLVDNIGKNNELVVLDQNGIQLFATKLSMFSRQVYVSSLSWSPDGKRIAFWYTINEDINRDLRLAVFDTNTQKTIDYCITNNGVTHYWHRNDVSPIWSPDGNFLVIEPSNADGNNPNVVIVDLIQERAVIVKTGYEPVGWMK